MQEDDVPENQREFIEINQRLAKLWPVISKRQPVQADADHWSTITDKRHLIDQTSNG
jgi:ferredoxin